MGRPHRDGQTDPVAAYFLISEGGSDPVIADVLGIKKRQLEGLIDQKADVVGNQIDPGRIKRLAEAFLDRHQARVEREATKAREEAGQAVLDFGVGPTPPAA
jgi:menaquinone-dependent protoporphyrinogen IX oxidase